MWVTATAEILLTVEDDESVHNLTQQEHSSTRDSFGQIKRWLKACDQHELCQQLANQDSFIPTRLLDLGMENQDLICLVETKGQKKYSKYSTLSHCWGAFVNLRMFRSNIEEFKKQIRLSEFPQNFKDAVYSARQLGISYIWIDSLCIMQGDADDWNAEAPRMHSVYGQSYINFAAASARNCHEGFFRHRQVSSLPPSTVETRWKGQQQTCKVIRNDFWTAELLNEPLYRRAWVLQERMLSPRTLNFGSRQIFWQCLGMTACESMPYGIPDVISDGGRDELQWRQFVNRKKKNTKQDQLYLREIWRHVVDTYMSCRITVTSDKLPALDGLREKLTGLLGEEYFAGLWQNDIAEQLAWQVTDASTADNTPARRQDGPSDTWIAPTWAWASVDGMVVVPKRLRQERSYKLEIVGKPQLTKDPKKPLALSAGHLNVKGKLFKLTFTRLDNAWEAVLSSNGDKSFCTLYPDEPLSAKYNGFKTDSFETLVMPLYYNEHQESGVDGRALSIFAGDKPGEYKRSGLIVFRDLNHAAWTAFQSCTISPDSAEDNSAFKLI